MEKSVLSDLGTVLGGVFAVLIVVLRPDLTPGFVHRCAALLPAADHARFEPIILIGTFLVAGRIAGCLLGMLIRRNGKNTRDSDPDTGAAS
jgi:hypothetical protein